MTKKIIRNMQVTNGITSYGKNIVSSVNGILANTTGELLLDVSSIQSGGEYGDTLLLNKENKIITDTLIKYARLVTNDELNDEKNTVVSWSDIFNNWYRFSNGTNGKFPADANELNGWRFNNTNNQIYSTINSNTYIGLVSPDRYDNYNLEVNVSSTDNDDDYIGLVLAFVTVNSKEYTLSAIRGCGGQNAPASNSWMIVYNYGQSDAKVITRSNYAFTLGTATKGWSLYPNGSNIKVIRNGNTITSETTDFLDITKYIEPLTVDLTSDPLLEKFITPCRVGYSCASQESSTFKTISFSGGNIILNVDTKEVIIYDFDTASWVISSQSILDYIQKGYIYCNKRTEQIYSLYDDTEIRKLSGVSIGNSSDEQVPNMKFYKSELGSNGYQIFPSGLCEAWGVSLNLSSSTPASVTLPISFSEIYNIQCTVKSSTAANDSIVSADFDTSSNMIYISTISSNTIDVFYKVIGKK